MSKEKGIAELGKEARYKIALSFAKVDKEISASEELLVTNVTIEDVIIDNHVYS